MAGTSRLNKSLWTNIERLKLYAKGDGDAKFILEKNPFDDDDDEEQDEYIIIGRVIPEAGIYKEDGFRIEMKITSKYPREPPEVRFLTPVYHPNIEIDGESINDLEI
jgi:ubiquitin-protein ligase